MLIDVALAQSVPVVVTFDSFSSNTVLTTQIANVFFTNAIVLTSGISLDDFEFPPHSGANVISDNGSPITITFNPPVQGVSGYFTYSTPLTMVAFNASNHQVAIATSRYSINEAFSGDQGSSPNEVIGVASSGGIASVTISGFGGGSSFTMDDLTIGSMPAGLEFYPLNPCRIADTRVPSFGTAFGPPAMSAGQTRIFNILSSPCASNIPSNVAAYSLNFTVVPPATGPPANLTTWPAGVAMPNASSLNYSNFVVANAAIVPAGTNGAIAVFANLPTEMLFDINGYFAPATSTGLEFYPVTPCRVADTRVASFGSAFGPPSMSAQQTRTFNIPNSPCASGIPATVAAYSFNFTVVPPAAGPAANLTTWPTGLVSGIPNVSTLNYYGSVVANAAIVPAGSGGAINVFVNFPTNVLFDINGYFGPALPSGLKFYPITPCRVADTRVSSFPAGYGPPGLAAGSTRLFDILSSACALTNSIPASAAAYSFNFTVVPPSGGPAANLTTWPAGLAMPNVSTLNFYGGVVANAAIVPAGANGAINVYANFPTDVLFDINGYFAP